MRDLVEFELADELKPAKAPDELWDRVMYGKTGAPVGRTSRRPWMMSAALTAATVMVFWVTLKHAQAAAFSCEPSPAVMLTSAKAVRGHGARMAAFGAPDVGHRGGAALADETCGHCHEAL